MLRFNPFWRNTRLEKHRAAGDPPASDPLNTDDPPRPATPVIQPGRKIVCEFCGCQVTPQGEVMRMGDKAKEFRDHENVVLKKDREIERLNTELAAVRQELEALKRSSGESRTDSSLGAFIR